MNRHAIFSKDKSHRYLLYRSWDLSRKTCCFVMFNPSSAGATSDDPTLKRCLSFADYFGCGALIVVNLFSKISADPTKIDKAFNVEREINSGINTYYRNKAIKHSDLVICAWGQQMGWPKEITEIDRPFHYLAQSKNGTPKHPLYLPKDSMLTLYDLD